MTWLLALIIAAMVALYSLGYLTACVVNAPLVGVPEHPLVESPRRLHVVRAEFADPSSASHTSRPDLGVGPAAGEGKASTLYDWQRDAEALGWLEGA